MKNRKGFTLVELLVTISIIGILSAIGLVLYSTVLKQSRDSKRQSDLKSIQLALEQYSNDQGFYPYADWPSFGNCGLNEKLAHTASCVTFDFRNHDGHPDSRTSGALSSVPIKTYMNSLPQDPTDPTGSTRYKYVSFPTACTGVDLGESGTTKCTSYCLYARLENPPSPIPSPPTGCTYPSGYSFVVTPP